MSRPVHTCHAMGCSARVPPRMFMCRRHWYMLPRATRDAVWSAYVPGQEVAKNPTREYLDVALGAIRWLAAREGITDGEPAEDSIRLRG